MKTKLLALALLAGGSMFAQTRFSIGISVGQNNRGYYAQVPPAYVPQPVYQPGYDARYQAPLPYTNGYAQQRFSRVYAQNRNRDFDQDDRLYNRDREFCGHDSDDRNDNRGRAFDRNRGNGQDYRQDGFRSR